MYSLWFSKTVTRFAFHILQERKKETARAYALLNEIEKQFKGSFQAATKRKIAVSYGIYNPMICDAFTRLHGRLTNDAEKERLVHYFICSSLFDDFTDYATINEEQLCNLSFHPTTYSPTTFDENAFLQSHLLLRDFVKDKIRYDEISRELYQAQMFSKKQYQSQLPDELIKDVTFSKGGYSVLLCRYYLDIDATTVEENCWYKLGTIIQLTNDLFDIYKDLQDNIHTLPNRMTNAFAFEKFFMEQINEMRDLINELPYSVDRKKEFALSMAGIYSFGLIAIDQLKNIQGSSLQLPDLKTLPRKVLIVDMEMRTNIAKWFKYTYTMAKLVHRQIV